MIPAQIGTITAHAIIRPRKKRAPVWDAVLRGMRFGVFARSSRAIDGWATAKGVVNPLMVLKSGSWKASTQHKSRFLTKR